MTAQTHDKPRRVRRTRFNLIQHRLEVDAPARACSRAQLDGATWPEAEPELGGSRE